MCLYEKSEKGLTFETIHKTKVQYSKNNSNTHLHSQKSIFYNSGNLILWCHKHEQQGALQHNGEPLLNIHQSDGCSSVFEALLFVTIEPD